ncbi:MAG: methyltransferase domain-containing protein [Micavibrio sp.]
MIPVFNRLQIKRQRARSALPPKDKAAQAPYFLFDWTLDRIEERIGIIRRDFPVCLRLGARGKPIEASIQGMEYHFTADSFYGCAAEERFILCDEEFLPFAARSIDLFYSPLNLHSVNDLPGTLLQIRQSLKDDGLFIAAMLGGETLYELRECLSLAEMEITGGISPRIAPFADKPQMGMLLQRAGFALPVVDSDIVRVSYQSVFDLMRDLRLMGEANALDARAGNFTRRSVFMRCAELYAQKYPAPDGRINASFEVIFLHGWAPHESQQKPLAPGSAKERLAAILGTEEIGTGEKPL